MSRGFVTQWAAMHPQKSDVVFFTNTLDEVRALAPLILKFRRTPGKKAFLAVTGSPQCPCEDAATILGWATAACHERRFKIFDLGIGTDSRETNMDPSFIHEVLATMKGLIRIHRPSLIVTTNTVVPAVREALTLAVARFDAVTTLVELPPSAVPFTLWIPDVRSVALQCKPLSTQSLASIWKLDTSFCKSGRIHSSTKLAILRLLLSSSRLNATTPSFFYRVHNLA